MGLNPGLNWSSSCSFGAFAHESNSNIDSSMLVFMVVRYLCTSCGSCGTICKLLQKLMRICLSDFRLQCWRMLIVMIIHHVTIGLWKLYCVQCVAWMSRCTVVMNHWKTIHTLGDCRLFWTGRYQKFRFMRHRHWVGNLCTVHTTMYTEKNSKEKKTCSDQQELSQYQNILIIILPCGSIHMFRGSVSRSREIRHSNRWMGR